MRRRYRDSVARMVAVATLTLMAGCGSSGSDVAMTPPDTTPMLRCGSQPFPLTALDNPSGAEHGTDPSDLALAAWLGHQEPSIDAPLTGWRRIRLDGDTAEYTTFGSDTPKGVSLSFERHGDMWKWSGSSGCGPAGVVVPGTAETRWSLDPDFPPPAPTDTIVHVLVNRTACNDGRQVTPDEVHPPVITATAGEVVVLFTSDPVSPGMHTCPGPMGTPLMLDLGEPLGARSLLDGGSYPPQPVISSAFP
jgi:hypothetical protein